MLRFPTRPAPALLGALALLVLALTACAPTPPVHAITPAANSPAPTVSPTLVLAPTPTSVPSGWMVLTTTHFSLAYPPNWTVETLASEKTYTIWAPAKSSAVQVTALPLADVTPYCQQESPSIRHMTLANLPMSFRFTGLGNSVRVWEFVNTQKMRYLLSVGDAAADAATQARDEAILATFRPDNAIPWSC